MCVCLITFQKVVSKCSICLAYFDECTYCPSNCVSQAPLQPPNCAVLVFISQFTNTHTHAYIQASSFTHTHTHTQSCAAAAQYTTKQIFIVSVFICCFIIASLFMSPFRLLGLRCAIYFAPLFRVKFGNCVSAARNCKIIFIYSFFLAIFAAPPPLCERVCVCV